MKGLHNENIAEHLGWDPRRVTNALTKKRTLPTATAFDLVEAVREIGNRNGRKGRDAVALLWPVATQADWYTKIRETTRTPAALILPGDVGRFAELIAQVVAGVNGVRIGDAKKKLVTRDIKAYIAKSARAMADAWELATLNAFLDSIEYKYFDETVHETIEFAAELAAPKGKKR